MKSIPVTFLIVFCVAIWNSQSNPVAMSCDSCGSECSRACGTRHFRSCCFNYVRKRSLNFHPYSLNRLRYETLYRRLPYGNNEEKIQNDKEQKNRKSYSEAVGHNELMNEISARGFFKQPKEDPEIEEASNNFDDKSQLA